MQERLTPALAEVQFDILPSDSEEEFIARQVKNVMVPWAVIKDGVWYERGELPAHGVAEQAKSLADFAC